MSTVEPRKVRCIICERHTAIEGALNCLQCEYRLANPTVILKDPTFPSTTQQIAKNLREFGYQVDDMYVADKVDRLALGETPKDIIDTFALNMLRENGYIAEAN